MAGYEGIGVVVVQAEGSAQSSFGRRVLPLRGQGTWQHFVDCDPSWLIAVPDDIDDETAARGYINPLAALLMLKRWDPANKRVLITAAGSSCAGLLRQWALEAGAREVVDVYRTMDRRASLESADLVFDAVGGALASSILCELRKDATFVSYGLLSGQTFAAGAEHARVERFHIRDCLNGLPADAWQAWFDEIWRRLRATRLPETTRFPMPDWRRALAFFREPGRTSKPLLVLDRMGRRRTHEQADLLRRLSLRRRAL